MVADAGLPPAALDQPTTPVLANGFVEVLRASARASGRADLGLLVADAFRFSMLGPLGLLMREQPTLADALAAYARLARAGTDPLSIWIERSGDELLLHPAPLGRMPHGEPIAIDMVMGDTVRALRTLVGQDWRPTQIWLTRPRPIDVDPYQRRFGAVVFDAPFNALRLTRADLAQPIPGADPDMAREIERFIEAGAVGGEAAFAAQVGELIVELLPTGACSVEQVALRLGVDRRTIHRRLALEAVSFTSLVDRRRRALIGVVLGQPGRPLGAVAQMLGFSSLSTFSRWHRHAFGEAARRSLRAPGDPTLS